VCDRYPGTVLFPNGDFDAFQQTVAKVVSELSTHRNRIARQPVVDSLPSLLRAYELPTITESSKQSDGQLKWAA